MASPERFVIHNARILTLAGPRGPRRVGGSLEKANGPSPTGRHADLLGIVPRGWVSFAEGRIEALGEGNPPRGELLDACGRVLLPGFIDCHTHACWAGQRFDEADLRLAGVPYLEILASGGGIMSTVRSTRAATREALTANLLSRLRAAVATGTTTIEVKSGYGLTPDDELKMLEAIRCTVEKTPLRVIPTFLGAHAKDDTNPQFVEETIGVTLPRAVAAFPGIACDAYCERGAWSAEECTKLFTRAKALGCPIRVHADQFNCLGMIETAIGLGARSVDHLEATQPAELQLLARSETIGVVLPGCGFHLDNRFANARGFLDAGGAIAIATNCNPGSSPTISMPFIIALAVRFLRLTPAEAIVAATINAAHVLGLADQVGSVEIGKRADVQLLATDDERTLAYEYANPGPEALWMGGRRVI